MSRTTQTKFMEQLEVLAATYRQEVIDDPQYANTGTVRFQPLTTFDTTVSFSYSFQEGYASFQNLKPRFGAEHLGGRELPRVTPEQLQTLVLDPIAAFLKNGS